MPLGIKYQRLKEIPGPLTAGHLLKDLKRKLQMRLCVCSGNTQPKPRRTLRNCRKEDRSSQDAVIAEPSGKQRSGYLVLQDDGDNRGLGEAGVIAQILQTTTQEAGVLLDSRYSFGLVRQNRQSLADRRHRRGAQRGREDIR